MQTSIEKTHGTRASYQGGCRCLPCRCANARYCSASRIARSEGRSNCRVSADPARRHILLLSSKGVGRRSLALAADIDQATLYKIRTGQKQFIRKTTLERILGVTPAAIADHARVPAAKTNRQIDILLDEGFTKSQLAARLGYKTHELFFHGKKHVVARNASRVDRFYQAVMRA